MAHRAWADENAGEKKPTRGPVFFNRADYFAAAEAATEAAEAAEAAAFTAVEAAAVASAAAEAATAAESAAGAGAAAAAGAASTAGAGVTTTGVSSFLLQAAKATASREMISKDFFMGFP
jgi:hypothetical protein